MDRSRTTDRLSRVWKVLGACVVAGAFGLMGCTLFETVEDRPQEVAAWDEDSWGPVLPHKTFPAECDLCHVTGSWSEIKESFDFDHAAETGHALVGAHAQARCLRCHNDRGAVEGFASRGCAGCHVDPHEGGLSSRCDTCHTEKDWSPQGVSAQHLAAGFPLYGAHGAISCDACHPNARSQDFTGAATRCITCHAADQRLPVSPDHVANAMNDCERCHVPLDWKRVRMEHDGFPLSGAHRQADCSACHGGGVYQGTPTDCFSCHGPEYTATSAPPHGAAGFGTNCQDCHGTSAWIPAQTDHTTWPLTGAHRTAACSSCHAGHVYAGTPRDCFSCHQGDYTATANPSHTAVGFGTACDDCHTTSRWRPANFNHSFPIDSGAHKDFSCTQCHTTGTYPAFSCTVCHSAGDTNGDHSGVSGYVYASPNCFSCHPNGKGD